MELAPEASLRRVQCPHRPHGLQDLLRRPVVLCQALTSPLLLGSLAPVVNNRHCSTRGRFPTEERAVGWLPGAAGVRAEEASHDACPVHRPGAGSPAILSPDDGHSAPSGRADAGHSLASPGALSRGGAGGPAPVPSAAAGGAWGRPTRLQRGVTVVVGVSAHAVGALLSKGALPGPWRGGARRG